MKPFIILSVSILQSTMVGVGSQSLPIYTPAPIAPSTPAPVVTVTTSTLAPAVTTATTTSAPASPSVPTTTTTTTGTTHAPSPTPNANSTLSPTTTSQKWSGCVDPSNPSALVTIGKPTYVCLQIGNNKNWTAGVNYIRASFRPVGDVYSRLYIPNSYTDLAVTSGTIWQDKDILVGAASQSALSFLRTYRDVNSTRIYPYLTAIIDVSKGVVQGIAWDNACIFCNKFTCDEITYNYAGQLQNQTMSGQPTTGCYFTEQECNGFASGSSSSSSGKNGTTAGGGGGGNTTACDLTLYVVWTGTDSKGIAFQSASSRFSAFPVQNLQDRLISSLPTFGLSRRLVEGEAEVAAVPQSVAPEF